MSSVINGIEETIAKTMGEIGWPGADLVAPEPEIETEEDKAEEIQEELQEESEDHQNESEEQTEEEQESQTEAKKTPLYQPKWKKAALEVLATLNEEQAELLRAEDKRREENFHKGIEQYREGHKKAKDWDDVVSPYRATFDSVGVQAKDAVKNLLTADHILRFGQAHQKIGTILTAIQSYGINPQDVVAVLQNVTGQPQQDPSQRIDNAYQQLDQRLRNFEQNQLQYQQQMEAQRQRQEQEIYREAERQIDSFKENPDYEHFELLRPMMSSLIQTGTAKDLTEAYDLAYKSHPTTAGLYVAEQQKKWASEKKAAVDKAKKFTNVRSNGRASVSKPERAGTTLEETIRIEAERLGLM